MLKTDRFKAFVEYFSTHQPDAKTELNYSNPYELLVAVILSAQCTDKRINQITPKLFEQYPDAFSLSQAEVEDIFQLIRSVSYPNNKARHLSGMARILVEQFNGEVPSSMEDLQKLPGVGRKTANVITSVVFEAPAMAVDTHVFRVANRLGLTRNASTPLAVEKQLIAYLPKETIRHAHHWLILHGRYICLARRPKCEICPITHFCKYYAYQQTATALTQAAIAERKKERELSKRKKVTKLTEALKKFEVKE
ncbi:endonuclease III [Desertivirga xinjiangensis]|uniref:endonuclease III n=1 Tax=Desertivirga xinjiangensis TaxID=539206 RepID=UPI00210C49B3|nr:endonuclease III [Pedobacter xinjiangensis]